MYCSEFNVFLNEIACPTITDYAFSNYSMKKRGTRTRIRCYDCIVPNTICAGQPKALKLNN